MKGKMFGRKPVMFVYFYFLVVFIGFVVYLVSIMNYGTYSIRLKIVSENCDEYYLRADVLDFSFISQFKRRMKMEDGVYTSEFPVSSKILSLGFCPNSQITLEGVDLLSGGRVVSVESSDIGWYCSNCYINFQTGEVLAVSDMFNAELETADITNFFPKSWKIAHFYIRYFPYCVVFGLLFLMMIFVLEGKMVLFKTVIYSGLVIGIVFCFYETIRDIFPLSRGGRYDVVSLSSYLGVSRLADYVIVGIILAIPFLIYVLLSYRSDLHDKKSDRVK